MLADVMFSVITVIAELASGSALNMVAARYVKLSSHSESLLGFILEMNSFYSRYSAIFFVIVFPSISIRAISFFFPTFSVRKFYKSI